LNVEKQVYKLVDDSLSNRNLKSFSYIPWCPAIEETVTLVVFGSVFNNLVNGKAEGCKRIDCHARRSPYCQIGKRVQAKL
jgi:hypothetical protein